ncbi:hypothetical protein TTHERM_000630538 (macronuclear) [Tetrahymena thermophila SB210]|uniref:Uncharacterized protein n=1 Tax=Tetrahymena thermophila (strain SB210) TaxID=312017 RepID=W7X810_TETTS|nr:hypothetical protein TTHERM_000630538 [Tetrahymena thermophila SB210]EWS72563.1 hypothetical protein TTHERM_000630538 [Tetrahymena thermophila SB210]|eukprot:XP_012654846.1 hypothetical protein TTHERM_000630538 [Tetrahymena thermophila SB210]
MLRPKQNQINFTQFFIKLFEIHQIRTNRTGLSVNQQVHLPAICQRQWNWYFQRQLKLNIQLLQQNLIQQQGT